MRIKTCYRQQYNIVYYSILMVNKCCVPAFRSNYKYVKKGVHLIKVTVFHFPREWLRICIFEESTLGDHAYTANI